MRVSQSCTIFPLELFHRNFASFWKKIITIITRLKDRKIYFNLLDALVVALMDARLERVRPISINKLYSIQLRYPRKGWKNPSPQKTSAGFAQRRRFTHTYRKKKRKQEIKKKKPSTKLSLGIEGGRLRNLRSGLLCERRGDGLCPRISSACMLCRLNIRSYANTRGVASAREKHRLVRRRCIERKQWLLSSLNKSKREKSLSPPDCVCLITD